MPWQKTVIGKWFPRSGIFYGIGHQVPLGLGIGQLPRKMTAHNFWLITEDQNVYFP